VRRLPRTLAYPSICHPVRRCARNRGPSSRRWRWHHGGGLCSNHPINDGHWHGRDVRVRSLRARASQRPLSQGLTRSVPRSGSPHASLRRRIRRLFHNHPDRVTGTVFPSTGNSATTRELAPAAPWQRNYSQGRSRVHLPFDFSPDAAFDCKGCNIRTHLL